MKRLFDELDQFKKHFDDGLQWHVNRLMQLMEKFP